MMMVRTDGNGDTLWTHLYGDSLATTGFSAISTSDGGFIACGYVDDLDPSWNRNTYVVRTNGSGDTLWTRTYLNPGYDLAWCISEAQGNGFILTGYRDFLGSAGLNLYITRIDGNGDVIWEKNYGQSGLDVGFSGIQTSDNGFAFCGQTNVEGNEFQALYLVRTNPFGDTLWTRMLGEYPKNTGYCLRQASDGGFIIAGSTNTASSDGLYDVLVIRTSEDGTVTSSDHLPAVARGLEVWPNPCRGTFRVRCPLPVLSAELLDLTGRTMQVSKQIIPPDNELLISLPSTGKAILMLRITTLQGAYTTKVIVL